MAALAGLETAKTKFLLYHDLASLCGGDAARARALFRSQLALVAGWGFTFRSMADFLAGDARGNRDVVITFDDGGRSFLDCALPVLDEFSATATMFVVAGFPGCKGRGIDFLSWDEIAMLQQRGIDIGSHALTHVPLPDIAPAQVEREIVSAAEVFAAHGIAPTTFAYPYGRPTPEAKRLVEQTGAKAAFTIKKGGRDAFELRRRLFTLHEPPALVRFFLADEYFPVRKAIVSIVPERFRREGRPIPDELWGATGFGIEGWTPPEV
jgi:peptidoglycan/xylan/chitin deacetylase (PgdA/CDA1 family)